ncbi:response regulator transcription factor [Actinoallomurus sp. NPDC050550]|uniref:response regulator transcription factor n=1 Tax=Actinoallomurus sp. NPDC050550 TaxID=3154937 RepID=UPI0033F7988C
MAISVLVADDQEMVRSGFCLILQAQDGIKVVGEAADGAQAVELVQRLRPDVCLMDIRMPKIDGLTATRTLLSSPQTRETKIIVVTTFDSDDYVYEALRAGAAGFVLKNSGPRFLVDAVRAAVDGGALISPSVTVRLLERFAHAVPSSEFGSPASAREDGRGGRTAEALTSRECEVVAKVARGRTNVEIATELAITVGTVKSHLMHVQEKLRARNRVEIAAWAWQHGLAR